jgi:tetratricopeptide (TPR) repeat protein
MKLKHQILIFSVLSMLIANVATAQKQPSQKELSAPQVAPSLSKPEVQRLIKEELEKEESKNEVKIRERVQTEVDRSFGWTMALIQVLLGVLTALPIFAGVVLFSLRSSIKNQIVEEAKNQVKEKLGVDVETALKEFDKRLKSETVRKTDEIILEVKKGMANLLVEAEKIKDDVVEKMGSLVPEISAKGVIRESIDPEILAKVQELTTTLEELQDRYPELVLTASDYVKKGDALYYEKSYKEALAAYEKAIELKPDFPDAWLNKGVTLGQLQRTEEALSNLEKAIELKPDFPDTWFNKGNTLVELKHSEEALAAYDKAIELKPDYHEAWFNKACLYGLNGNAKLAIQNLKKSIEINSSNREKAKTEPDFDNIRDDQEFKRLIEDI